MKVKYESVTEVIEIEVSEKWGRILENMNYKDSLIERRETRRHESLNLSLDESPWLISHEDDPDELIAEIEDRHRIGTAMKKLSDKQADVILYVVYKGYGIAEYAAMRGISQPTATERFKSAKKKLKKFL